MYRSRTVGHGQQWVMVLVRVNGIKSLVMGHRSWVIGHGSSVMGQGGSTILHFRARQQLEMSIGIDIPSCSLLGVPGKWEK